MALDLITHQDKVYRYVEVGAFCGYVPFPGVSKEAPYMEWRGGRIPFSVWEQVIAFFQEHKSNEVQVRLYYHGVTQEWRAHAFPQRYPSGMTTKELPEHANFAPDMALFPEPWIQLGTVHHHCGMAAFQSSTDSGNEEGIPGLHITIGKLNDAEYDIHGRVCVRMPGILDDEGKLVAPSVQAFYEPDYIDWFEAPDCIKMMNWRTQEKIIRAMLVQPVTGVTYPARWKENLIPFEVTSAGGYMGSRAPVVYPSNYQYQHHTIPDVTLKNMKMDHSTKKHVIHLLEVVKANKEMDLGKAHDVLLKLDDASPLVEVFSEALWVGTKLCSLHAFCAAMRGLKFENPRGSKYWCRPEDSQLVHQWLTDMQAFRSETVNLQNQEQMHFERMAERAAAAMPTQQANEHTDYNPYCND